MQRYACASRPTTASQNEGMAAPRCRRIPCRAQFEMVIVRSVCLPVFECLAPVLCFRFAHPVDARLLRPESFTDFTQRVPSADTGMHDGFSARATIVINAIRTCRHCELATRSADNIASASGCSFISFRRGLTVLATGRLHSEREFNPISYGRRRLAAYIARSACAISVSASLPSMGKHAIPTLASSSMTPSGSA